MGKTRLKFESSKLQKSHWKCISILFLLLSAKRKLNPEILLQLEKSQYKGHWHTHKKKKLCTIFFLGPITGKKEHHCCVLHCCHTSLESGIHIFWPRLLMSLLLHGSLMQNLTYPQHFPFKGVCGKRVQQSMTGRKHELFQQHQVNRIYKWWRA